MKHKGRLTAKPSQGGTRKKGNFVVDMSKMPPEKAECKGPIRGKRWSSSRSFL